MSGILPRKLSFLIRNGVSSIEGLLGVPKSEEKKKTDFWVCAKTSSFAVYNVIPLDLTYAPSRSREIRNFIAGKICGSVNPDMVSLSNDGFCLVSRNRNSGFTSST